MHVNYVQSTAAALLCNMSITESAFRCLVMKLKALVVLCHQLQRMYVHARIGCQLQRQDCKYLKRGSERHFVTLSGILTYSEYCSCGCFDLREACLAATGVLLYSISLRQQLGFCRLVIGWQP